MMMTGDSFILYFVKVLLYSPIHSYQCEGLIGD